MQNANGEIVDKYIPRKCSATNRILTCDDKASVQFNIGHVDANGVYTGEFETLAISGFVRSKGESDAAVTRLAREKNVL